MTLTDTTDALLADAAHLLDLLDMLPSRDDTDFWARLEYAEHGDRQDDDYFVSKVALVIRDLRNLVENEKAVDLAYAAQYVLMFFDRDDQKLFEALDGVTDYAVADGRTGKRWAEDAAATAWKLYVPAWAQQRRER